MHTKILIVAAAFSAVGCASPKDVYTAQRNIIRNDNRNTDSLSKQHEQVLAGDAEGLRQEVARLREETKAVNAKADQIAQEAISAGSVAAKAVAGLEAYVGTIGGPIGGALGAALEGVSQKLADQGDALIKFDDRLMQVRDTARDAASTSATNAVNIERVSANVQSLQSRVESLSPELRESLIRIGNVSEEIATIRSSALTEAQVSDRVNELLASRGLTQAQIGEIRDEFSTEEIITILVSLGLGGGGGLLASRTGRSRNEPKVNALESRVNALEHKA